MDKLVRLIKSGVYITKSAAQHRVGPYAAQASFFILMSFIPSLMFLISMVNHALPYVIPVSDIEIFTQINAFFPEPISGFLEGIVREILEKSSGISIVTAITSLWFSSRGIMALNQGINNVLSDGELQNYFFVRGMSLIYMFVFTLLVSLTIALLGFGNLLYKIPGLEFVSQLLHLRWLIVFAILTVFFTLFYKFMPKRHHSFKKLLPGAALAAAGWLIFTYGFRVYVSFSKSYTSIYGSISYIVLAMLWLYFCMNILLFGAEFNHCLDELLNNKK